MQPARSSARSSSGTAVIPLLLSATALSAEREAVLGGPCADDGAHGVVAPRARRSALPSSATISPPAAGSPPALLLATPASSCCKASVRSARGGIAPGRRG